MPREPRNSIELYARRCTGNDISGSLARQRNGLVPILDHIKEETPAVEILADVIPSSVKNSEAIEWAG
jgi:hypothetical protein